MDRVVKLLVSLGIENPVFEESVRSSVTTAWGVNWDDDFIARDIMQNFFDANRHCLAQVCVTTNGSDVSISAPTEYDLTRLYLLGSEKGPDDVGIYGEGFKAAVVCILRRHKATIIAASGTQVLQIRVDELPAGKTKLYPLVYDRFSTSTPIRGNRLVLRDTTPHLAAAMKRGLTHFFYEGNPLLGEQLDAEGDDFVVYRATSSEGHMFYRNLRRGELPGIPLVLVLNKKYEAIERLVKNDRDRNAFGEHVRNAFYAVWARSYFKPMWGDGRQRLLVESARPLWERGEGHPLLAKVADCMRWRERWASASAEAVFGDRFFACSPKAEPGLTLRYKTIEEDWLRHSRTALPGYFARFGVPSAEQHVKEADEQARKEAQTQGVRPPSPCETQAIELLAGLVRELAPEIMVNFDRGRTVYSVAKTEVLLGELKQGRQYNSREVYLAESVFGASLGHALAVFLHEHAHIFGHDGSRGFTDSLTRLIEAVISLRVILDLAEQRWNEVCTRIAAERGSKLTQAREVSDILGNYNRNDLLSLLEKVPRTLLQSLLEKKG